jgi:hypothetical protein
MARKGYKPEEIIGHPRTVEIVSAKGAQCLRPVGNSGSPSRPTIGGRRRIWRQEGLKEPQRQPKRARLWLADGSCLRTAGGVSEPCLVV